MKIGISVAVVTPFNEGKVDISVHQAHIEYLINNGVDSITLLGTTGESSTLDESEKKLLINATKEVIGINASLIVGVITNCTKKAVEYTRFATKQKADGILAITPYYNKCNDEGLVKHFKSIADATNLPIIMYNVPSRTGYNLPINAIKNLQKQPNIVAIKEANASIERLNSLNSNLNECNLNIVCGEDSAYLPFMAYGNFDIISVVGNIAPNLLRELKSSYLNSQQEKILQLNQLLVKLSNLLFQETNPIPIKYALQTIGYKSMELRLPLTTLSNSLRQEFPKKLHTILDEISNCCN